jgi:hypothetical protein
MEIIAFGPAQHSPYRGDVEKVLEMEQLDSYGVLCGESKCRHYFGRFGAVCAIRLKSSMIIYVIIT